MAGATVKLTGRQGAPKIKNGADGRPTPSPHGVSKCLAKEAQGKLCLMRSELGKKCRHMEAVPFAPESASSVGSGKCGHHSESAGEPTPLRAHSVGAGRIHPAKNKDVQSRGRAGGMIMSDLYTVHGEGIQPPSMSRELDEMEEASQSKGLSTQGGLFALCPLRRDTRIGRGGEEPRLPADEDQVRTGRGPRPCDQVFEG